MNTLKQQIDETRNYLFQNRMYSELEGFDTALRMFADANKKSFKDKAAEVWKKHKGKIIAGAALAAAAGTGGYLGYKAKQKSDVKDATANAMQKVAQSLKGMTREERVDYIYNLLKTRGEEFFTPLVGGKIMAQSWSYPEEFKEAKAKYEMEKRVNKLKNYIPQGVAPVPVKK